MTIKNIPVGYKDSPLGIIPVEWEVKRLGEVCNSISSGNNKERNDNGDYPVYGSTGLIGYSNVCIYDIPQILVARVGAHAGYVYCVDGNYDVSDNTLILNLKSTYHFDFAYNQLLHYNLNRYIFGSGQPLVTAGQLKSLRIPLPPLAEQEKIAEILSTWDKAIERQTQLIQKLELRKKGLMQQLLTGKKRLPGFTGEWEKVKLGEIGDTYNGLTGKAKEDFETGNARYIPYINVFSNERIVLNGLLSVKVYPDELQNLVQFGDVFFTVSSETPNEVGMSSVLLDYLDNTYLNSFCFGYRMKNFTDLSPVYAMYLFRSRSFRKKMVVLAQGSTRYNISKKEVLGIIVKIPSLQEQTAIANILSLCDEEIRLAQDKLAAMKEQKKGLMQVLLTGKRRIKI